MVKPGMSTNKPTREWLRLARIVAGWHGRGATQRAAKLLSPSSRLTKRTNGVVLRPLHRDHVASRLVMPPLRSLTIFH
jgi:hypothetical protein